jgi:putative Mg2+ transporter-C (MgtC) family protein
MDPIADELFSIPGTTQTLVVIVRIVAAGLLGAVIGGERELEGKAAGLRTHMLVALGAALFVIAPREAGLRGGELTRVIQGVAAGIGFIGAGTILKLAEREQIRGLTTAASIWMTAAIGIAAGLAPLWLPILCAACAWVVLYAVGKIEKRLSQPDRV